MGSKDTQEWIRARTEEQVDCRVRSILEAAARLYETHRFDEITFSMIAREAGFTRSNLYRYFQTKEEVFLEILKVDLSQWVDRFASSVQPGTIGVEEFAQEWIDALLASPRMLGLLSILTTKLEPGASLDSVVSFKEVISGLNRAEAELLVRAFPALTMPAAGEILMLRSSLIVGAYPAMNPTGKQIEAMKAAGIEFAPEFFRGMMIRTIENQLRLLTR